MIRRAPPCLLSRVEVAEESVQRRPPTPQVDSWFTCGQTFLLLLGLLLRLRLGVLVVTARLAFLPALFARGLVFLTPLFSPATSALSIREITCSQQRGADRKRPSDLF